MQDFANLTEELLPGRCRPEVQFEGMSSGVKVEKLDNYDGGKQRNMDTCLFQGSKTLEFDEYSLVQTCHICCVVVVRKFHKLVARTVQKE